MIAKEKPDEKVYENILQGTIIHLVSGTTHTEVTLELESKSTITATITNDTCKELGLENGQATYAFFKASSVILGV